jgi:hypothetical protein
MTVSRCCNLKTVCFLASPWNLPVRFQFGAICLLQELKIDFTCYDHPVVLTVEEQVSEPRSLYFCSAMVSDKSLSVLIDLLFGFARPNMLAI